MSQNKTYKLYYKHGCHLCEEMAIQLVNLQKIQPFDIEYIDIETDSKFYAKYAEFIPVLTNHQDQLICQYFFDEAIFQQYDKK